jgi:metal-dependent amidase/aminoacylase/carboxypeptidase family protein
MNQEIKDTIIQNIDSLDKELREISLKVRFICVCVNLFTNWNVKIHDDPELGNREFHAYKLLTGYLEGKGFSITHHAVGLETAFIAKYVNDDAGRRVGFCCEYDALPG